MFNDRQEAGKELAKKLASYRGKDAVVLALPRGGVVPAYEIAHALGLPLDIVAVRKIGAPGNPEYALGAIDEQGTRLMGEAAGGFDKAWLNEEAGQQRAEAKRRAQLYRGKRPAFALSGKTVILVDDGIATGLTMRLAVKVVREQKPKKIVVAVPVAPEDSLEALKKEAEVIVLEPPSEFLGAVGAHYIRFDQVTDAEVIALLKA